MSRELNYENAKNDDFVVSFVNTLQNELPEGYRLGVANGHPAVVDEDNNVTIPAERPRIFIYVEHGDEVSMLTPLFQIDRDYNLYNVSANLIQSNGANIQTMIINPQSDAAMNGWNSARNHIDYQRQVWHLDEDLHPMMNNNDDIQYNLGDRFVNGRRLT